ncbi:MAG: tetratricopeptide repeat protein [Phycisphaerae bacterium]|nr:tetratricopeptide repeat protein [Phycisphaerae bacterium]
MQNNSDPMQIRHLALRWALLGALVITGAGVLAYSNTFKNPFIFDDDRCIVRNKHITKLWPLSDILTARPKSRSIINLSLAVNYAISEHDVWSYHVFNLTVHILAGITLFGVVRRTLVSDRLKKHIGRAVTPLALVVALIWVLHPLQTSAVTYIIQRAESVMGLFYLLTLYCAIRSFYSSTRWRWSWFACAIIACGLGMRTKQVIITAPIMVLLYDWVFLSRSIEKALRKRWLLYLGLAATWLLLSASLELAFKDPTAGFAMKTMTSWEYARTQFGVILHYIRLSVLPVGLCLDYRWPVAETVWQIAPQAIVIAGLLALTAWAMRRRPALGFAGLWFFGILSVSSTIIPIADLAFEHRTYLSLAGVIALIVIGGYALAQALLRRSALGERKRNLLVPAAGGAVALAIIAVLGGLTFARNHQYSSKGKMWLDVTKKRPDNARSHYNLGNHHARENENEEAIESYKIAIRLQPDYAHAQYNLGNVLRKLKRYDESIHYYQLAIKNRETLDGRTKLAKVYNNLASVYVHLKQLDKAVPYYERAIKVKRDYAQAYNNLGVVAMRTGKLDDAVAYYKKALRFKGDYTDAKRNLATVLRRKGDLDAAIEQYRQVIKDKDTPTSRAKLAETYSNVGSALVKKGKPTEAIPYYRKAIEAKPDYVDAHYNLGVALSQTGKHHEAIQSYLNAIRVKPDYAMAHQNVGLLLAGAKRHREAIEHFRAAVNSRPGFINAMNNLAWILATCPDDSLRDGPQALKLAQAVCKGTEYKNPNYMDALSAAYAETGQFDKAVATAQRALQMAATAKKKRLVRKFQGRLKLYQQGKPLRF